VLTIGNLTLDGNTADVGSAAYLRNSKVQLDGVLDVESGEVRVSNTWINGAGTLELHENSTLVAGEGTTSRTSVFRGIQIKGLGNIVVMPNEQLRIESGSTIDLNGIDGVGLCNDINQAGTWGQVDVQGSLVVKNADVQNANVQVKLVGLQDSSLIELNDITLLESVEGFGGEFFVEGNSTIQCNVITSYGDRYLDMDPDPTVVPRPVIQDNLISVIITQGTQTGFGELLELRTEDQDLAINNGASGAHFLASSAGYDDTWTLERLEVMPNAKVTLTNRPGFEFQNPSIPAFEALYVKEVILHENAILNTGLQRMYYQTLTQMSGAQIVDQPLLGYSLKVIAMEDDTEFAVRVRKRLRDPSDVQPCECPATCPGDPDANPDPSACIRGAIERIDNPVGPGGVMEMRTRMPGQPSASSVAAHGAFARAGNEQVTVSFKYLFCDSVPGQSLIVYLSESPEVDEGPVVELATIVPPVAGPGSVGSGEFATFSGIFPAGMLNFRRGTYVELVLAGQDACVLIDDWDPLACGSPECGDFDLSYFISNVDLLYGLTALGDEVNGINSCLDRASRDNYVDINDILLADALYGYQVSGICDANGTSSFAPTVNSVALAGGSLIVAAKPGDPGNQADRLYGVNPAASSAVAEFAPPVAAGDAGYGQRGHGRLITDGDGRLYQIHSVAGLVGVEDGQTVIAPGEQIVDGNVVRIGLVSTGAGLPILDAAFDPMDPTIAYVVPVRVVPPDGEEFAFQAAARLELSEDIQTGDVSWSIAGIQDVLGVDPRFDPINNTTPPEYSQTNIQFLREIETDEAGRVFVTSARADNANDWLLVYDAAVGVNSRQAFRLSDFASPLRGPTAMKRIDGTASLFIGSALEDAAPTTCMLHEFQIGGTPGVATLSQTRVIEIDNMRFLSSVVESPSGEAFALGFTSPAYEPFDPGLFFSDSDGLYTTATLALIPATGYIANATALSGASIALPVSAAFAGGCLKGDMDGSMAVEVADIPLFVDVILNGTTDPAEACRVDVNQDGTIDGRDVVEFGLILIS